MLLALLYPTILSLDRLQTTRLPQRNGVLQCLTGLPTYPDASELRGFLSRSAPSLVPVLHRLHDRLLQQMTAQRHSPSPVILDIDSMVLVVYAQQEQARTGCSPIKRGRPSYHAFLCLRQQILLMPAQLRGAGNRPRLALPASGQRERARHYDLRTIDRLNV